MNNYTHTRAYIHILFDPLKPELGVIPSGQKKNIQEWTFNFPSKELKVTDITEQ